MSFNNHLIFSLFCCIIFIKFFCLNYKINLFNLVIFSLFSSLLPDIDHINSFIGNKIKFISYFIYKYFGHRKITHSFIFIFFIYIIFNFIFLYLFKIDISTKYGFFIGYFSHILADMLSIKGVNVFWPFKIYLKFPYFYISNKKLEYLICLYLLFFSIFFENLICILKNLFKYIYLI